MSKKIILYVMMVVILLSFSSCKQKVSNYIKGEKLFNEQAYTESVNYLGKAIKEDDHTVDAYYLIIESYEVLNEYENMDQSLESLCQFVNTQYDHHSLTYINHMDTIREKVLVLQEQNKTLGKWLEAYLAEKPIALLKSGVYVGERILNFKEKEGQYIYYSNNNEDDPGEVGQPLPPEGILLKPGTYYIKAVAYNDEGLCSMVSEYTYEIREEEEQFLK